MNHWFQLVAVIMLIYPSICCEQLARGQSGGTSGKSAQLSLKTDDKARAVIQEIKARLAPLEGYHAKFISHSPSPHGGLNKIQNEQWLRRPDHILLKSHPLMAIGDDNPGTSTVACDGKWLISRTESAPPTEKQKKEIEESPNAGSKMSEKDKAELRKTMLNSYTKSFYHKLDLDELKMTGRSKEDYLTGMTNLLEPFAVVDREKIQLIGEDAENWILITGMKQPIISDRMKMTVSKKTGFIQRMAIEFKMEGMPPETIKKMAATMGMEGDPPQMVLFELQEAEALSAAKLPDSIFKIETPEHAFVMDETLALRPTDQTQAAIEETEQKTKEIQAYHAKLVRYVDDADGIGKQRAQEELWVRPPNHILQKQFLKINSDIEIDTTYTTALSGEYLYILRQDALLGPEQLKAIDKFVAEKKVPDAEIPRMRQGMIDSHKPLFTKIRTVEQAVMEMDIVLHAPFEGCDQERIRLISRDADRLIFEAQAKALTMRNQSANQNNSAGVTTLKLTVSAKNGLLLKKSRQIPDQPEQIILEVDQVEILQPAALPDALFQPSPPLGAEVSIQE